MTRNKRSGGATDGPTGRAVVLADAMARLIENEDVADVTIALALLTSGTIEFYAENLAKARTLLAGLRKLEDEFILRAFSFSGSGTIQ